VFGIITAAALTGLATSPLVSFEGSRDFEADYLGGFLSTIFNYSGSQLKMKLIIKVIRK
jgi:hypothetical protein